MDYAEPSSPIPGPSNYRHGQSAHTLDHHHHQPNSPPPTRRRLSSRSCRPIRSFPRKTYRQVTLSECLNTSLSSPSAPRTLNTNLQTQSSPHQHHENLLPTSDHDPPDSLHVSNPLQRPPLVPLVFNSEQDARSSHRSRSNQITCSSPDRVSSPFPSCLPSSPSNPSKITRKRFATVDYFFESELSYRKPFYSELTRRIKVIQSLSSNPETHTIKLWNSGYEHGYEFPFSLAFNHRAQNGDVGAPPAEGELMAVGTALGNISLYRPSEVGSPEDRLPVTKLQGIQNGIFALTFSSSGLMLATGSGAQVSEIFDVESGNMIGRLEGHGGTVKTIEFSPYDEQMIVTGSRDGSIKLWDLRTVGTQFSDDDAGFPAHPPVLTIQNAHDEKYTGRKRKKGVHIPSVSSVLWSRLADRHLYSAGSANGVVKLWDVRKKSEFNSKKAHPTPADQSLDYQSYCDISGSIEGERHEGNFGFDGAISQRPHGVSSLVSSSDGARMYALGTDSRIQTHDTLFLSRPPSSRLRTYSHPSLIATSLYLKLALTKDDEFLACCSSTGEIYIWDTSHPMDCYPNRDLMDDDLDYLVEGDDGIAKKTGSETGPVILLGHRKEVCALQFWRQGLASCSDDSSVRIWSYHHALFQPV